MDSLFTIIEAWRIAKNPSDRQMNLAKLRASICDGCDSKKTITELVEIGIVCSECGCPISKKVFANVQNPCPLKKWEDIDKPFFETKANNTLV